ncbi:MAG: hypothetical protein ACR2O4_04985 [Hyphomicrobiaceae bacterium]
MSDLVFAAEQTLTLGELASSIGEPFDLPQRAETPVTAVAPIQAAQPGALSFLRARKLTPGAVPAIPDDACVVHALSEEEISTLNPNAVFIRTVNPRRWFMHAVRLLFPKAERPFDGISQQAAINESATIGHGTAVGPFVVIDACACIGRNCQIHPGVHISRNVVIGDDVVIQSNTIVGGIGQANEKLSDGTSVTLPHLATVRIGNGTRIGTNASIIRGTLQHTTIGQRCLIGNHVNIGHNSTVGDDNFISAGAILCGSVRVGNGCWIAPAATIMNKLSIGDGAMVGLGALVTKSVEPEQFVAMRGAKPYPKRNHYNRTT